MKITQKILILLFILIVILSVANPLNRTTYARSQQPYDIQDIKSTPSLNGDYQAYLPVINNQLGEVYYVSPNGTDNNPGTFSLPWRTLGKAATMVMPGDIVYIRGGVYQEAVEFSNYGTSQAPIRILAYFGETPIIDGNNYTLPHDYGGALLEISGNYNFVSGLEVRYSSYLGVLAKGAHAVANKINAHHNLHSGMRIEGDFSIIEYSQVWSNDMQNYNGQYPQGDSTALTASRQPNYAIIRHNVVYENWGIGLSTYEANGTIIEDNVVYDNYYSNIYLSNATNVIFQRNFIYATGNMTGGTQIGIQVEDEAPGPSSKNISIINNIVYGTNRNLACYKGVLDMKMTEVLIANNTFVNSSGEGNIRISSGLSFENVFFMNNIVKQDDELPIILLPTAHSGLSFSNNLWSKAPNPSALSPGDFIGNPLFEQTGDPFSPEWFKLSVASPAIDRALSLPNITHDFFLNPREATPDMGAHELLLP
jgi:hypothetical protein